MTVETPEDLRGLLRIGRVVGMTLRAMQEALRPGMTTGELDAIADAELRRHHARPAPRITLNFPGVACISVNDEAAHGIPGQRVIQPGDLVKLDVSAELEGYFADAAVSVPVPPITPRQRRLCDCAKATFDAALATARAGTPINQIGRIAELTARRWGFRAIGELPGHGVGKALHEWPSVPNVFLRQARQQLSEGLVITIEPHVAAGAGRLKTDADGWTLRTRDGGWVAAHEHTLVITRDRPILVTAV